MLLAVSVITNVILLTVTLIRPTGSRVLRGSFRPRTVR